MGLFSIIVFRVSLSMAISLEMSTINSYSCSSKLSLTLSISFKLSLTKSAKISWQEVSTKECGFFLGWLSREGFFSRRPESTKASSISLATFWCTSSTWVIKSIKDNLPLSFARHFPMSVGFPGLKKNKKSYYKQIKT